MEKRVQLEMRTLKPDQIEELILDNCRSTTIVGITDDFVNLETLSLINVGLTSLKGFPKLPNLKKLELSDNRITGGLNLLHTSPKLSHLNLSGNKIASLEALEPLKEFKHLKSLDLFNNEATQLSNYRELIFDLIPSLKFLDGFDAEDREAEDSENEEDDVNGNEEEGDSEDGEDEDEEGLEDEEEDLDEDDEVGLDAVYKDNLDEESDGDDYDGEAGEEEDDDVLDEEEEEGEDAAEDVAEEGAEEDEEAEGAAAAATSDEASQTRGKKRKHEGEEEVN